MDRMPVLFIGHGSPMNIVENNRFTEGWKSIAQEIPTPHSILCISAHWYDRGEAVSSTENPPTIHDFYGFPEALYEIEYPAPGASDLAQKVYELFDGEVKVDNRRGLDHGTWSVLHFMYPEANIPVCQLQVNADFTPQESYQVGQRLQRLRAEEVLIMGSGNIVHNLSMIGWDGPGGYPWADQFDAYIQESILKGDHDAVISYHAAGSSADHAVFYRDHFDPLLYALGATNPDESVRVYNDERVMGSLSMTSYLIG